MKYSKPTMTFVNLRAKENIADTCWGLKPGHTHDVEHYYDVEGIGYVSFHVKGSGSCASPDAYNIFYYEYKDSEGVRADGTPYEKELEAALKLKGGNDGQPYKGLSFDFPVRPDPEWS